MAYVLTKDQPELPPSHDLEMTDIQEWSYTGNRHHPTEKSVKVLTTLIRHFTPAGGLVFDPLAGSGSTLVAAKATGLDWLGIELTDYHCATGRRRLSEA